MNWNGFHQGIGHPGNVLATCGRGRGRSGNECRNQWAIQHVNDWKSLLIGAPTHPNLYSTSSKPSHRNNTIQHLHL
jgi:hypothetical protein